MQIRRADEVHARALSEYGSVGVVSFLAQGGAHVVRMELPAGGRIGRHPAASDQVFVVVAGAGTVNGVPVAAGDVVRWAAGEEHETLTTDGLVALVVEAAPLDLA